MGHKHRPSKHCRENVFVFTEAAAAHKSRKREKKKSFVGKIRSTKFVNVDEASGMLIYNIFPSIVGNLAK
jgi:hypothetical protein